MNSGATKQRAINAKLCYFWQFGHSISRYKVRKVNTEYWQLLNTAYGYGPQKIHYSIGLYKTSLNCLLIGVPSQSFCSDRRFGDFYGRNVAMRNNVILFYILNRK